jgi:putative membrane protein insertion efficiency factor
VGFIRDNIAGAAKQVGNIVRSYRQEPEASLVEPSALVDPNEKKDWTVLTYLEGRDRLSHSVHVALNGMEEIGSTDDVNIVSQATMVPEFGDRRYEGMGEVNTRRYYITKDNDEHKVTSPVLDDLGEQTELTPKTAEEFFSWGVKNFPAKHYVFVFKKHGAGFAKNGKTVPISAREMRDTLERVESRTGVKPDVLSWDACNMMQMEVQYELKDRAQVMTGSPEVIRAVKFPYPTLLHNVTKYAEDQTPESVGQTVVKAYNVDAPATTQVAVSLEKMAEVGKSVQNFVSTLFQEKVPREVLYTNLMKSATFEPRESLGLNYNFRDFAGFLENVGSDKKIQSKKVKEAAIKAYKAVKGSELARHLHPSTQGVKHLSDGAGSSAFLPWRSPSDKLRESYGELAWAKDTGWDKLLDYVLEDPKASQQTEGSKLELEMGLGKMALYGYKKFVSPFLLSGCPYDPSCSQFAREALEQHGIWEGSKISFMRVLACEGHGAGGHDPVPHAHHDGECDHEHHHHTPDNVGLPEVTLHAPQKPEKSELRKRAEGLLFKTARTTGKLLGGAVAAVAGAPVGAVLGGLWGAKAGAGTLDEFNQTVREKYGNHKTDSLQALQAPLAAAGTKTREAVAEVTGSQLLGKVAGAVAGTVAGAAMGGLGAAYFCYNFFGSFAGLGLQNIAKNSVGELPVHHHTEQILRRDYAA